LIRMKKKRRAGKKTSEGAFDQLGQMNTKLRVSRRGIPIQEVTNLGKKRNKRPFVSERELQRRGHFSRWGGDSLRRCLGGR